MNKGGFVAIVGKPNVGKSTLLNAFVGAKISVATPKPHTTRNRILGIKSGENYQVIFVDTPGVSKTKSQLDKFMKKSIREGTSGVDAILVVVDGTKIDERDFQIIEEMKRRSIPLFVAVNKMDKFSFEKVYPKLAELQKLDGITEIISISAETGKNVQLLFEKVLDILGESEVFFDKDLLTDKSESFLAQEIIRQKTLLFLQEEIPHGIAVEVTKFLEVDFGLRIEADIICERKNHKQIIIGKKGEMLKRILSSARLEIEKLLKKHVFLTGFVKVRENWKNNPTWLKSAGYDTKDA